MTCSTLPDVNVWIALIIRSHVHHAAARRWYENLPRTEWPAFCRVTQLGFLRLLTQEAVAGKDVCNQQQAWSLYDQLLKDGGANFREEPFSGSESEFRKLTRGTTRSSKDWTDSYLAAFCVSSSLSLITFDQALSKRVPQAVLLG